MVRSAAPMGLFGEGFDGSADMKRLLPSETQMFSHVSSELTTLMAKVAKSPLVLNIINIQGIIEV